MDKYFLINAVETLEHVIRNMYGNLSLIKTKIMLPKEFKNNVKQNIKYKNIHEGKRCFILGNGPSLKEQDLSPLKNEIVFVVNQASRNPQICELKPKYHFWVDPVFFDLDELDSADMEVLQTYKDLYREDNRPITFLPQQAYSFVKKYKLDEEIDIQYFVSKVVSRKKYKEDFNFEKVVPCFGTVVQTCIAMSFYMGFDEIYLLGCDTTGILSMISGAMNYNDAQYSYTITENEKNRMHAMYSDSKFLKESIHCFADLLDSYEKLKDYALEQGIELYNCSAKTILTTVPRKEFKSLFNSL